MNNAEGDRRLAMVDAAVAALGEHFDCVQILVSWNQESNTHDIFRGCGNWYARQGMANTFIQRDQAQDAAVEIAEQLRGD
jgi:hypothetical protein